MVKAKKGEIVKTFDEIISFESLYKAHRRARLGKRHKKEVIEFEMNLSENLWKLHYELKYGTYKIEDYNEFMVFDPKEREIQAIHYRDRIVQHSICDNFFIPVLDRRLIYDNSACRVGKGTHFIMKRLKKFMREYYRENGAVGYFIKFDIRKYFPSIVHNVLLSKIRRLPIDKPTYELTEKIIRSYGNGYGLPMGNQSSQCFALYYLDKVDRYVKEQLRIKHYVRYMDDMIIMVGSKAKAKEVFEKVSAEIVASGLDVNKKSQIISIKNGIEFLGWRFHFGANGKIVQTMKHSAVKRIYAKASAKAYDLKGEKGNNVQIDAMLCSYKGHLLHGRAFHFYKKVESKLSSVKQCTN